MVAVVIVLAFAAHRAQLLRQHRAQRQLQLQYRLHQAVLRNFI
ncbi:hypothetical protein DTO96_101485 [Ephemeroptericola cinctiostellae]|uniref:Uncharacterized protein n=1 Tax=Ephemeroptericola cinctiostellae TaxID=2268024 RepID=A0A345DBL1_9BURK|nr:hypothetical protein DTO96_101485 [Ephemeroptericola cinctiostellae]